MERHKTLNEVLSELKKISQTSKAAIIDNEGLILASTLSSAEEEKFSAMSTIAIDLNKKGFQILNNEKLVTDILIGEAGFTAIINLSSDIESKSFKNWAVLVISCPKKDEIGKILQYSLKASEKIKSVLYK
jgi:predicted regulator of Ras-like GTPase activity (Roadblock/LC7/MglB family)